jgi:hypothetical protein
MKNEQWKTNNEELPISLSPSGQWRREGNLPCLCPLERIKAAKRSAVSTGQLRPLLALHTRPIDLVVFQEPVLHKAAGGLVLRRVSRLDAFSVYPGRTLATQRCR